MTTEETIRVLLSILVKDLNHTLDYNAKFQALHLAINALKLCEGNGLSPQKAVETDYVNFISGLGISIDE